MIPAGLAVLWEIAVRMGLSNGRLVPPPSVIWNTFTDLTATGELAQHARAQGHAKKALRVRLAPRDGESPG